MPLIVGIDPDLHGGIATSAGHVEALHLGDRDRNREVLARLCAGADAVYLETVPYVPGNGHVGMRTQSRHWGMVRERLDSLGARVVEVDPSLWQGALGLRAGRGEGRKPHKARMHRVALRFAPGCPLAWADAVLIAQYGLGLSRTAQGAA